MPAVLRSGWRIFFAANDRAWERGLIRDHHAQRAVRLDHVDPLHVNLAEFLPRVLLRESRHRDGDQRQRKKRRIKGQESRTRHKVHGSPSG
jgi:hypothetical protein